MRDLMNLVETDGEVLLTKQIVLKDGTPATLQAKKMGYGISVNVEAAGEFCGGTNFGENSWADMPGTWSATTSHVNTEWRRKGVATAVYDAMEEMGHTVVPEPRHHKRTADAEAFWKNRKLRESVSPQSVIDVANHLLSIRDDLLDDDEEVDQLVPGDEQFAEEIIRREYVSGTCGAYAIALHDKTSYPIVGFNGGMHIAVRAPDSEIIDYLGKNPVAAVLKRYGMGRNTPVQEWTREEAVEHILMGDEEGDPWDDISVAKWVLAHRSQLTESDYRGEHIAPSKDGGAPLYDLTAEGMYPEDVYGPNGMRYYASDEPEAFSKCMAYKGRPNKVITIYRAVPADLVHPKITPGDWVAITPAYAREHGRSHLQGAFKVLTKTVYARDIFTEGNSLDEWGYDPQPFVSRADEDIIRQRLGMKTIADARAAAAQKAQVSEAYEWRKMMSGDVEVMIDVAKVDASFAKDREFYVGPQGAGGISGRYERFGDWLKGGAPVGMPEVCLDDAGEIAFINGRHRFAWMRDHGVKTMPVAVPKSCADGVKEKFGARLDEVQMIDDFGDGGYEMERVFHRWTKECVDATVVGTVGEFELRTKEIGGRTMIFVCKGDECVGRATVDDANGYENTAKVAHIVVHPDYRRKGLGLALYEFVLKSKRIISDYDQTRFGRAMWQQLANKHVVHVVEIDGSIGERIRDVSPIYGTRQRMIASMAETVEEGWQEEKSKIEAIDGERWTHLEALLAFKGFHPIGVGSKSRVYGSDSYPYVVKLFRKDRAYEAFLSFAKAFPNKHYAKARGEVKTISQEGEYRIIRLEKLVRASEATQRMYQESMRALTSLRVLKALGHHDDGDLIASFERFANYGIKDNAHLEAMIEKDEQLLADMPPSFVEAMRQIIDSFSDSEVGAFDTNPANIMHRPDGTPVIIDPLQPRY